MNKNLLSSLFVFATGAAIGSVVTWKLVKTKYEQIAQEEIESVREMYERVSEKPESEEDDESDEEDLKEYEEIVQSANYKPYKKDKIEEGEEDDIMIEPYVIEPEEFDENGYETVTLFYYEDGVVATADTNEVVENVDELIGEDSLTHFGEYEEDSVFVRNDNLKTDFEILKDRRRFSEVE